MDLARFIAIALVVILHSTDTIIVGKHVLNDFQWGVYQTLRILGRIGVPIFIMISGSLLLPNAMKITPLQFYKKRIPQFIFVLIFYFFFINITHSIIYDKEFNIFELATSLRDGNLMSAYQLWFLYTIIGIYIVTPFISRMLSTLNDKDVLLYIILCFMAFFVTSSQFFAFGTWPFYYPINGEFLGTYTAYFIFGYLVTNRNLFIKVSLTIPVIVIIIGFSLTLFVQFYLRNSPNLSGEGFTWYNTIGVFAISTSTYILFSRIKNNSIACFSKYITFLSESSFCVFLFHLIPLYFFTKYPVSLNEGIKIDILALSLLSYISSILFYMLFFKVPIIRFLVK